MFIHNSQKSVLLSNKSSSYAFPIVTKYAVLFWFVIEVPLLVMYVLQGYFEVLVSFSCFFKAILKF